MPVTGPGEMRTRVQDRLTAEGQYPRWVLLTALVGMFATSFPVTILTVSLETMARDFDTSVTTMSWVISAPLIGSAVALPVLGKMGDLYGHRRVFLVGFTAATIITALTVLAWDPFSLIGLRTGAMVVGAATQPSSMALILGVTPAHQRVKALGWWSLVAAGSPALGLVAGGPMVEAIGWRPVFGVQALGSVVAVAVAYLVLRETDRRTDVGFDLAGAVTLALAAAGFMFALNQAPEQGLTTIIAAAAVIGVVGMAAFIIAERRVRFPLLPLAFFRRRNFTAGVVGSVFSGAAYMGGFVIAPLLLAAVFDFAVWQISLLLLIRPVLFSASSPIAGHIATRRGERLVGVVGTSSIGLAMILLAVSSSTAVLALVVVGLIFQGIGNGGAQPTLSASLANAVDESDLGIASATQRMSFQVGSALGITIMTAVYGDTGQAADITTSYLVGAGLGLIAIAAAVFIRSSPPETEPGGDAEPVEPIAEAEEELVAELPADQPDIIAADPPPATVSFTGDRAGW